MKNEGISNLGLRRLAALPVSAEMYDCEMFRERIAGDSAPVGVHQQCQC